MTTKARYSEDLQQEARSRSHVIDRLTEFSWKPTVVTTDVGEDLIVDVYIRGRATGINFYVQLKSVQDLSKRRAGDVLRYDLKKEHLLHWEQFRLPVVLIVWDVRRREGRWALVAELISDLDERRPAWRQNKTTVRVLLPWDNTTDDEGLQRLRQRIGRHVYPLLTRGRTERRVHLQFPDTPEGCEAREALERLITHGERAEISGTYLTEPPVPDWMVDWFLPDLDLSKSLLILGPTSDQEPVLIQLEIVPTTGETRHLPKLSMRRARVGTQCTELSNRRDGSGGIEGVIVLDKTDGISLKLSGWGESAYDARDMLSFMEALANGGTVHIRMLEPKVATASLPVPARPERAPNPRHKALVDALCTIQDRTGRCVRIPPDGPTQQDAVTFHDLYSVVTRGRITRTGRGATGSVTVDRSGVEAVLQHQVGSQPVVAVDTFDESAFEVFGVRFDTGRMVRRITGIFETSEREMREWLAGTSADERMTLALRDASLVQFYPEWLRQEAERLARLLKDRFAAQRVFLFGSLAWDDELMIEGDLDLAVQGVPADQFFDAVACVLGATACEVDVVDLSTLPDPLRDRIQREGREL